MRITVHPERQHVHGCPAAIAGEEAPGRPEQDGPTAGPPDASHEHVHLLRGGIIQDRGRHAAIAADYLSEGMPGGGGDQDGRVGRNRGAQLLNSGQFTAKGDRVPEAVRDDPDEFVRDNYLLYNWLMQQHN